MITEEITYKTISRCKVCGDKFDTGSFDMVRLHTVGICEDCDFWVEKWQMRHSPDVARIGGEHYIVGARLDNYELNESDTLEKIAADFSSNRRTKGMGGEKYIIRFDDGRIAITDDLWHQGSIPPRFRAALPDNAKFI